MIGLMKIRQETGQPRTGQDKVKRDICIGVKSRTKDKTKTKASHKPK